MSDAKSEILDRIRRAKVTSEPATLLAPSPPSSPRSRAEIVEQFAEYVAEYRANVIRTSVSDLQSAIRQALLANGTERLVVPADLPQDLRTESCVPDAGFDNAALDQFQSVITTCAVAVAETGTIVLDAGPGQGRRALSLIPDHHICIVYEDQIVDSVPEAVAALAPAVAQGQPLTWISGPSATSDIELSRVEGVHGPRILDVVLVVQP